VRVGEARISRPAWAWVRERFPVANAPLIALVYLAALMAGRAAVRRPPALGALAVAGYVGALAFFLMLRALDDIADYDSDCVDHPDRLLQRGVVTRGDLQRVAAAALAVQLAVALIADRGVGRVTLWWLVSLAYVALALRDFFAAGALATRPLLHRLLRAPASSLAVLWMAQIGAGDAALASGVAWLVVLALALTATLDVGRKLSEGALGGRTARTAFAAAPVALAASAALLLDALGEGSAAAYTVLAVAAAAALGGAIRFDPGVSALAVGVSTLLTVIVACAL